MITDISVLLCHDSVTSCALICEEIISLDYTVQVRDSERASVAASQLEVLPRPMPLKQKAKAELRQQIEELTERLREAEGRLDGDAYAVRGPTEGRGGRAASGRIGARDHSPEGMTR